MTTDATSVTDDNSEITTTGQRLTFTIPSPATTLVLGTQHWDGDGYDGFSVVTDAHMFMQGLSDSSTFTLETPGQVSLSSTAGKVNVLAQDDLLLYTADKGFFAAKNWLMISSGAEGKQRIGIGLISDAKPENVVATDELSSQISEVRSTVNTAITWTGIASAALGVLSVLAGRTAQFKNALMGVGALVFKALRKCLSPNYDGDVHVFGADNVTVSSASKVNVVAGESVWTAAPYVTSFGALSSSINSPAQASVTAGYQASLTGFYEAKITSLKQVSLVSRFGTVAIKGLNVAIGSAAVHWPQAPTMVVSTTAMQSITLLVNNIFTTTSLAMDKLGIVASGPTVAILSKLKASVAAGMFALDVGPDGAALVNTFAPEAATTGVQAATLAADTQIEALYAAYEAAANALLAIPVDPATPVAVADAARSAAVGLAIATLHAATAIAKASPAFLRVAVTPTDAHLAGGVGKISVDILGNITLDGMGMPITIKTGAASIVLTPLGIKMGPILVQG